MKNYTIIPKKIIEYKSNSKLLDIYTFACIKSKMDYKKGISKINKKTLSNVFNIPERTSSNTIIRLEEQKLLTIERKLYENKNANIKSKTILKNYYKFDLCPEHYFFVCNEFLTSNLPKEIKGFLLIIKAICLNNTNFYKTKKTIKDSINKSELSKLINMDIKTIEKYLNLIKGLNEIAIIENSIILKNNYFPLRVKENGNKLDNRKTEIINTILEICNNYNAMIPLINEQELKRILIYYP